MKNAANCVNQCELQDTLIIDTSNAHGGLSLGLGHARLRVGFSANARFRRFFDVANGSEFLSGVGISAVLECDFWERRDFSSLAETRMVLAFGRAVLLLPWVGSRRTSIEFSTSTRAR